jgi:hypothetical protein
MVGLLDNYLADEMEFQMVAMTDAYLVARLVE